MEVPTVSRSRVSHGWVIVAVSFVLLIGAFGTQMCFGLFLKPLAQQFGWSRAAVSGAMSLLMAVSGLMGVVMGKVTDRWGARAAIAPGIVVGAIGYLLTSRMGHLWEFYLWFGVGGGILVGCCYTPAITVVSGWYGPRQRTMAIGTALLGVIIGLASLSFSVGAIVGPFLAGHIYDSSGNYDLAFLLFGIFLVIGTISLYFLRTPREMVAIRKTPDLASEGRTGIIA